MKLASGCYPSFQSSHQMLYNVLLAIYQLNSTITKNMTAKTINRIGIPHGYFLDLLDISIPREYAKCYYF